MRKVAAAAGNNTEFTIVKIAVDTLLNFQDELGGEDVPEIISTISNLTGVPAENISAKVNGSSLMLEVTLLLIQLNASQIRDF